MAAFMKPISYQEIQKALNVLKEEHERVVELNKKLVSNNLQKAFFTGRVDELIFDGLYKGGEVTVVTLTGGKIPINVSYTDTVETVQNKIYETSGIPIVNQRLIFGGRRLKPHRSIYFYKIPIGGTLHLTMNMHSIHPWCPSDSKEIADDNYYLDEALTKLNERQHFYTTYVRPRPSLCKLAVTPEPRPFNPISP